VIVAIDGPAGSGKSTVARAVAKRCGLTYLDTGAMYRTVALRCLQRSIDLSNAEAVTAVARGCDISFGVAEDGSQTVSEAGEDVTSAIRTAEVDHNVSAAAAVPAVREAMVARQRELGSAGNVVAEGRDIGTVVFPNAEVKVFLTADPKARAHRRAVQRGGEAAGADTAEEQRILDDLVRRDRIDSTREDSPLRPAEGSVKMDSSSMTVEEEVQRIVSLMVAAGWRGKGTDAAGGGEESGHEAAADSVGTSGASAGTASPEPVADGANGASSKAAAATETPARKRDRMRAFAGNSFDDYFDHDMRDFPAPSRAMLRFVAAVVGGVTKVLWPWTIEDGEKLWGDERGRVIVMNHTSMLDPICIIVSALFHGQRVRCVYKSEFDSAKIVTWLFSRAGAIPVVRGTADVKAVRRAERALKRGEMVLVFPEGTRVKSDDQEVTIHGGFALMAQLAKAPVQPMAIVGARDITPKGSHLNRFGRVYLKVGDCITFDELGVRGKKARNAKMEEVAMGRVYQLRDELRREHPGKM
jgi:cytidylate kinase